MLYALFIYLRIVRSAKDIVYTDTIKLSKQEKGFCRRDALTIFKFRQQRLIYAGFHLQRYLRISPAFSQFSQSIFHNITNDIMS